MSRLFLIFLEPHHFKSGVTSAEALCQLTQLAKADKLSSSDLLYRVLLYPAHFTVDPFYLPPPVSGLDDGYQVPFLKAVKYGRFIYGLIFAFNTLLHDNSTVEYLFIIISYGEGEQIHYQ